MRKGSKQRGRFNVERGMAFTIPYLTEIRKKIKDAGSHPWLVTDVFNDYIEIIMCTTLTSNKENKHRLGKSLNLNSDLRNPCPPMDRPKTRISGAALNTAMLLPKKELFSHNIHILNENLPKKNFTTHGTGALCLNSADIDNIQKDAREYRSQHHEPIFDPFECQDWEAYLYDLEDEDTRGTVPKWFTKAKYDQRFKWQHLPKADWKAVYPFEDQMHDYEKADPELIRIAKLKKYGPQKSKPNPSRKISHEEIVRQAEAVSDRTNATPDDSYQKE